MTGTAKRQTWEAPIHQFLAYSEEVEILTHIHANGLNQLIARPKVLRILYDTIDNDDSKAELAEADRNAAYAEAARDNGHTLLLGHSVMGLWSALEAAVEDLACAWIQLHSETLEAPGLAKVRIPLAEYMRLSPDERTSLLIAEIQRDLRTELAVGVTRFEKLMNAIGLGGQLTDELRKALFEMWQVRNVLSHRGGVCDRKFTEACPWIELKIGERLVVEWHRFNYYLHATHAYSVILFNRCRIKSGLNALETTDCFGNYLTQLEHCTAHRISLRRSASDEVELKVSDDIAGANVLDPNMSRA